MKTTINFLIISTLFLLMNCKKTDDEAVVPVGFGFNPPRYFCVIVDKATGKDLLDANNVASLRMYYLKDGVKMYNKPLYGGAVSYTYPELLTAGIIYLDKLLCYDGKKYAFNNAFVDVNGISLCYDLKISDFYLELAGKTIGKITLSVKVVENTAPESSQGTLGYQGYFVKIDQLKFNDVAVKPTRLDCPGDIYELPVL